MSRKPVNLVCSGILTAAFAAGALFAGVANAQESGPTTQARSAILEEVIVTARKRAESLQNVPVSIIALGDEKLDDFGLQTLESVSAYVPGVTIGEAVVSTNLFVRGIGSGVNQGFEQSVGVYVDGIYMGRGFQTRAPFLDLERIEILKGPQGTLFGKNTIAGALNIVTAKPTDQFEGEVTALYEPDHGEGALTAVVSGPLSDTLSARLAARASTLDGYMKNTLSGEKDPREDDRVVRASLRWTPTDRLEVNTRFETGSFDVDGRVSQALSLDAATLALFQGFDPQADGIFNERRSLGGEHPLFAAEFNHAEVDNFVTTIDYSLGDHTLTSVTGYSAYDYHEVAEGDFTPLDTANQDTVQDFEQWSQEVRLSSPDDRPFRYIVGLYYQKAELDSVIRVDIDLRDLLGAPIIGSRHNTFLHDAETFAAFFEASLDFGDRWTLNAGLRYSDEEKSVWKRQVSAELGTDIPDPGSLLFILGWVNHTLVDKRSESQAAPSVSLQFDATENIMTYVSASKGFKGGGYDEARADGDPDLFEYEEETVVSVEAGAKMTLLHGAATLNAAVFHSNFEDLQVSTFRRHQLHSRQCRGSNHTGPGNRRKLARDRFPHPGWRIDRARCGVRLVSGRRLLCQSDGSGRVCRPPAGPRRRKIAVRAGPVRESQCGIRGYARQLNANLGKNRSQLLGRHTARERQRSRPGAIAEFLRYGGRPGRACRCRRPMGSRRHWQKSHGQIDQVLGERPACRHQQQLLRPPGPPAQHRRTVQVLILGIRKASES